MKRLLKPLDWLVQSLLFSPRRLRDLQGADHTLARFLHWRRRTLVLVLLFTILSATVHTLTELVNEPRPSFNLVLKLEPESGPVEQTLFGDIADVFWLLSFYAMPASALLAACFWARPRMSRAILVTGWVASFLVPVAIALTPWGWWSVEPPPPQTPTAKLVRQYERIAEGVAWGYYYVAVLSPSVLALVPGMMRACLRVKRLLPESILPGWFLIAAAPFNGLLVLVVFVALAQVAPSPLLLTGMVLWLAAPFVYLAHAKVYTRPLASARELRSARQAQSIAWLLTLGSVTCLGIYVATWEVFGLRLVGTEVKTSLLHPWDVLRYLLDFAGRALFMTVLGADLLLQATLSAWRRQREFEASAAAVEHHRLMMRLEDVTGTRKPDSDG